MRASSRWLVRAALLGIAVATGCGGLEEQCGSDSDCGPAAQCDSRMKVCFQRRDDGTCSNSCADWQYCSETACYPRYQPLITVLEPVPGVVDRGSPVRVQLQTVASWIQPSGANLEYTVTINSAEENRVGLNSAGAGSYDGQLMVSGAGEYVLKVGFKTFPTGAPVSPDISITVR